MKKTVPIIRNILLAFVLISIGFALGKNYSSQNIKTEISVQESSSIANNSFIHVYYFHSTFRCSTCNRIEEMTKKSLEKNFSEQLSKKGIVFSDVDFQSNKK